MRGIRVFSTSAGVVCGLLAAFVALPAQASVIPNKPRPVHVSVKPALALRASSVHSWRVDARLTLDTAQAPHEFSNGFFFSDVEAVGPHDAWAVGTQGRNIGYWAKPEMRHWHYGHWLKVTLPGWMDGSAPGGWINQLQAVGGSSPDNVWAAGPIFGDVSSLDRAVHWNGKRWAKAGVLPTAGEFAPQMTSLLSFGPDNVWAFGCYCGASQSPYIAHFSRGAWRDVTPATLPFGGIWTGAATSPSNIWAVMSDTNIGTFTVLHWNGAAWKVLHIPATLTSGASQFVPGGGIVVTKTNGVWLAGSLASNFTGAVVHLVGGKWHLTQTKTPTAMQTLAPDGRGGFWSSTQAVGNSSAQIWRFSARKWTQVADPVGVTGQYAVTWMTHIPGSRTTLAVGLDTKNELLLSSR